MAKITQAERQERNKAARIHLAKYYAFSNLFNYYNAEIVCDTHHYRKMDVTESTKYYISLGWMDGEPLKYSGYAINNCRYDPKRQCAVIAHTPLQEAKLIFDDIEISQNLSSGWRSFNKTKSNSGFLCVTRALNAYCRCHPEVLRLFPDMDDIPVRIPDADEQAEALMAWNGMCEEFTPSHFEGVNLALLLDLIGRREFADFFHGMPENVMRCLVLTKVMQYQNLVFMQQEDYNYYMSLTENAMRESDIPAYQEVHDQLLFYQHFLLHGNVDEHLAQMHPHTQPYALLSAIKCLNEGRADEAAKQLQKFLKATNRIIFGDVYSDYVYLVAILRSETSQINKTATTLLKKLTAHDTIPQYVLLMLEMKAHPEKDFSKWVENRPNNTNSNFLSRAFYSLIVAGYGHSDSLLTTGNQCAGIIQKNKLKVVALEFAQVFDCLKPDMAQLQSDTSMQPLLTSMRRIEPWEQVLDILMQKYDSSQKSASTGKRKEESAESKEISRVIYWLDTHDYNVVPRLQKSKNGGTTWTAGRNIALKTFDKGMPEMTPQDVLVSKCIETYTYGWYGQTEMELRGPKVVAALVGSPVVFDSQNPELKIEIQSEKLQIQVKETRNGFVVSKNVKSNNGAYNRMSVVKENAQLIKVIELSPQEIEILHLFDRAGIFPLSAREPLTKILAMLGSKVTVLSALLGEADNVKKVEGDTNLTVQVVPYGDFFTVRCFVKPLIDKPPYCTPGRGLEYIAANKDGETFQVARNLKAEKKNRDEMLSWMEHLDEYGTDNGWQLPMEQCLDVLDLLRQHSDICRIEWPEGVKFRITHPMIGADQLRLSVNGVGHWFEVDGEVKIDDRTSLKIAELLKRVRESKGRFILLGDDEYVAISRELKKQLNALDGVLLSEKKKLKLSEFNSSFLSELDNSGVSLSGDKTYQTMQHRIEESDKLTIKVPKMLQAELRDYQLDGYRWMTRLAHWGAGACLADDMGLGKTVQTIALLLSRAKQGPSLVVMPTSVLINWQNELKRFAPTLNPVILRQAANRKDAIDTASNGDIVLATYGLLPTEEELLVSKKWNVVVLDEAHTIKNKETKTSKVAMQLEADFRLLLTGTPLQNHLSEVWNLFQFATPGLLKDFKHFTQDFINPIERDQQKEPQRLLKRILSPFILRRTKNEVLNELPEKTEITLKIELSEAERALYNHLREEAILNIEEGDRKSAIKALAEITRLRQTACNAALVIPAKEAKAIPSSKSEAFMKLVDELIQNNHRALVFSQFTSHLALIEKELKRRSIDYQYIDGAVSPAERIRRVDDFQKGEQPLFLISLKAGGTGLNLTSADYVIHLDPWWNPAIEDQASDRAYRIGQDKPVTVYRLIAADTIEEKILALHQTKKSLADALLEGSDMSHRLSADEILELIRS